MKKTSCFDRAMETLEKVGFRSGRRASSGAAVVCKVVALSIAGVALGAVVLVWAFARGAVRKGPVYY